MSFRPATLFDAQPLYEMRKAAEAEPWYGGKKTTWDQHVAWLKPRLDNSLVTVALWNNGEGVVRVDSNGELAFHGPAEMLQELVRKHPRKLKATVDVGDPKAELLKAAGFKVYPATFLAYKP